MFMEDAVQTWQKSFFESWHIHDVYISPNNLDDVDVDKISLAVEYKKYCFLS